LGFIALGVFMSVVRKYMFIAPISLSITLLVTSCNESKVSQCQQLIQVVNQGTSLIDTNKGKQVTTSLQLSRDLENVTTSLRDLNLSDPKLKELQNSFVKVFQSLSQAIAEAAQALGTAKSADASLTGKEKIQRARTEIDSALTSAKIAGKDSDNLGEQLNRYCTPLLK
jgi:hypothetical protein